MGVVMRLLMLSGLGVFVVSSFVLVLGLCAAAARGDQATTDRAVRTDR